MGKKPSTQYYTAMTGPKRSSDRRTSGRRTTGKKMSTNYETAMEYEL